MVVEGESAPDFELLNDEGEVVRLSNLRGNPVVLYFYPADDTPGCTTQACGFRDAYETFRRRGVTVLGVSPDDVASHALFKRKYELPFALLADPGHEVAEAYGVWGEQTWNGETFMGVSRSTFLIDPDGKVTKTMLGVNPEHHADDVLAALP